MAFTMDHCIGKIAIVTGGTTAIGYAIVEELLNVEVNVVAVAQEMAKLDEVSKKLQGKKGKIFTYSADMNKEEDVLSLFKWVKENLGTVHILVNNTSIYPKMHFAEEDAETWKTGLDLLVVAMRNTIFEAVENMRINNVDGHIINMNAIDGDKSVNIPLSVISDSRYAVVELTEAFRNHFKIFNEKIQVSSIFPGFVNIGDVDTMFTEVNRTLTAVMEDLGTYPILQPGDVANAIIYVLSSSPYFQIHEMAINSIEEKLS